MCLFWLFHGYLRVFFVKKIGIVKHSGFPSLAGEQLYALRRLIVWLCLFIVVLTAAVCMLAYWLIQLQHVDPIVVPTGQNFSTVDASAPTVTTNTQS